MFWILIQLKSFINMFLLKFNWIAQCYKLSVSILIRMMVMKLRSLKVHYIFTVIKLILFFFFFGAWRHSGSHLKRKFVAFLSILWMDYVVNILLNATVLKILSSKHISLSSLIQYIHQVVYCFLLSCDCLLKTLYSFIQVIELLWLLIDYLMKTAVLYLVLMLLIFYLVL